MAPRHTGYAAVAADVKAGEVRPVYLLYGDDRFTRQRAVSLLEEAVAPGPERALNRLVVDGAETAAAAIAAALATGGLFGGNSLVVVREVERMPEGELARLGEVAAGVGSGSFLILLADVLDRRRRVVQDLLQAVEACGRVVPCDLPPRERLPRWIRERAARSGLGLDEAAARALLDAVGPELAALDTEIEKLAVWAGPEATIDAGQVAELASRSIPSVAEYAVFHLVDQVIAGQAAPALSHLNDLLAVGESPLGILAMLSRQYRSILIVQPIAARAGTAADVQAATGFRGYGAHKLLRQAARVPAERAARALDHILACDERIKKGANPRLMLEALIARLSAQAAGNPSLPAV